VILKFYTKTLKIVNGKLTISALFSYDEIQSFEEDEVAEKGLGLPALYQHGSGPARRPTGGQKPFGGVGPLRRRQGGTFEAFDYGP
jgi:hypothetical protein